MNPSDSKKPRCEGYRKYGSFMTFEDWADIYDCAEENSRILADWKAERVQFLEAIEAAKVLLQDNKIEREKLIGALEYNEHFKNAVEKFCEEKQGQQNMTDKLEGFASGWLAARAVLAEVIGEKQELPKFKDIIGLFVEEQNKEVGR